MSDKKKIPIEEIKKIPPVLLLNMINRAKNKLKENQVMKDICAKYDADINDIDLIPIMFGDIDVSAKTDHGVIILNYKLLCDGDFLNDYSYLIHECDHWYQQCFGNEPTKSADDGDYLKNPFEQEAFQHQIQYIHDEMGEDEAHKYTNNLLNHHDKSGEEKEELKDILMNKI